MSRCLFTWAQYKQKHTSYSERSQHSNHLRLGCTCICCRPLRFCRGSADMGVSLGHSIIWPALRAAGNDRIVGRWEARHRTNSDDVGVRFDRLHHGGIWAPSQQIKKPLAWSGCDQGANPCPSLGRAWSDGTRALIGRARR